MNRCKLLRSHGVTRDFSQMEGEPDGDWYYEQIALGLNYRMTVLAGGPWRKPNDLTQRFYSSATGFG